jgi:hypothetical protein
MHAVFVDQDLALRIEDAVLQARRYLVVSSPFQLPCQPCTLPKGADQESR